MATNISDRPESRIGRKDNTILWSILALLLLGVVGFVIYDTYYAERSVAYSNTDITTPATTNP